MSNCLLPAHAHTAECLEEGAGLGSSPVERFQAVLLKQCQALIALGFDPAFKVGGVVWVCLVFGPYAGSVYTSLGGVLLAPSNITLIVLILSEVCCVFFFHNWHIVYHYVHCSF